MLTLHTCIRGMLGKLWMLHLLHTSTEENFQDLDEICRLWLWFMVSRLPSSYQNAMSRHDLCDHEDSAIDR